VVERDRKPAHRHRGHRKRLRLHLGRKCPEFRLTPWHNDPVSDPTGEAFYIRDDATAPSGRRLRFPPADEPDTTAGMDSDTASSSTFEDELASDLTVFVAMDAPVKNRPAETAQPLGADAPPVACPATSSW
jgi:hypothetical protein